MPEIDQFFKVVFFPSISDMVLERQGFKFGIEPNVELI